jgi:HD-like signal output (HDOD) protein
MDLQSLIYHPSKLPTVPRIAQRVIASFSSEEVTLGEIAELIAADPVLSVKLLRLANSAYFRVSSSVETVDDAVHILGMTMVRHLVLGSGMVGAFINTPDMNLHQFWTFGLYTACAARWLADCCAVNRDVAFTVGLVHGIGELHLHSVAPSAMVALDQRANVLADERLALETRVLGFNYLDVSAALAKLWNFPVSLIEPLEQIGTPLSAPKFSATAAVVHLGMWRARHEMLATPSEELVHSYPHSLGERLGIDFSCVFAKQNCEPTRTHQNTMPELHELSRGLDAMLG